MKKTVCFIVIITLVLLAVQQAYCNVRQDNTVKLCRDFLSGYGWQTADTPRECVEISVPTVFDNVYRNYNAIQQTAGLDLAPYGGRSGTRYTFTVTNYPTDVGENVYANVIVIDSNPVAGDIMTVSLNGFMHALNENQPR